MHEAPAYSAVLSRCIRTFLSTSYAPVRCAILTRTVAARGADPISPTVPSDACALLVEARVRSLCGEDLMPAMESPDLISRLASSHKQPADARKLPHGGLISLRCRQWALIDLGAKPVGVYPAMPPGPAHASGVDRAVRPETGELLAMLDRRLITEMLDRSGVRIFAARARYANSGLAPILFADVARQPRRRGVGRRSQARGRSTVAQPARQMLETQQPGAHLRAAVAEQGLRTGRHGREGRSSDVADIRAPEK